MLEPEFEFKPSQRYQLIVLIIALVSAGIFFAQPLSLAIRLLGAAVIVAYSGYIFLAYGQLRGRKAVTNIKRKQDGHWLIRINGGQYEAELGGDSTVTTVVSVLKFRIPSRYWTLSCVIFPDSLSKDQYRQLLVVLRMY